MLLFMILILIIIGIVLISRENKKNKEQQKRRYDRIQGMIENELNETGHSVTAQTYRDVSYGLPSTCPRCNKLAHWKSADTYTERQLKSAHTIGGYTQLNVEEKDVTRFICSECGFEMNKSKYNT